MNHVVERVGVRYICNGLIVLMCASYFYTVYLFGRIIINVRLHYTNKHSRLVGKRLY